MKKIKKVFVNSLIILFIFSCSSSDNDTDSKNDVKQEQLEISRYSGEYEGQKDSDYGLIISNNKVEYSYQGKILGEGEVEFRKGPIDTREKPFPPPPDTLVFIFNKQCVNNSDFLLDRCFQKTLFNDPYIIPLQRIASQSTFVRKKQIVN